MLLFSLLFNLFWNFSFIYFIVISIREGNVWEREREREREREIEWQRQRERGSEKQWESDRNRQKQTETDRNRQRQTETERKICILKMQISFWTWKGFTWKGFVFFCCFFNRIFVNFWNFWKKNFNLLKKTFNFYGKNQFIIFKNEWIQFMIIDFLYLILLKGTKRIGY